MTKKIRVLKLNKPYNADILDSYPMVDTVEYHSISYKQLIVAGSNGGANKPRLFKSVRFRVPLSLVPTALQNIDFNNYKQVMFDIFGIVEVSVSVCIDRTSLTVNTSDPYTYSADYMNVVNFVLENFDFSSVTKVAFVGGGSINRIDELSNVTSVKLHLTSRSIYRAIINGAFPNLIELQISPILIREQCTRHIPKLVLRHNRRFQDALAIGCRVAKDIIPNYDELVLKINGHINDNEMHCSISLAIINSIVSQGKSIVVSVVMKSTSSDETRDFLNATADRISTLAKYFDTQMIVPHNLRFEWNVTTPHGLIKYNMSTTASPDEIRELIANIRQRIADKNY